MKRIDLFHLAWREAVRNKKNMCLALGLEAILFLNIIVLLLFSTEIDSVFDAYCQKKLDEVYDVIIYSVDGTTLHELEQDGFSDIELCYDEKGHLYFSYARLISLKNLDFKIIKWKSRGITIRAFMSEIIYTMIFIKAIFLFISILGILLGVLSLENFYQMQRYKRKDYTNMLIRLGMRSSKIYQLFLIPFLVIDFLSACIAYLISFPVLDYINTLIRQSFSGISIDTEKRGILAIIILAIEGLILLLQGGRNEKKRLY